MSKSLDNVALGIRSKFNENVYNIIGLDMKGAPSLICKQLIVQNYCPKISVISTTSSDALASTLGFGNFLELLRCFEQGLLDQDPGIIASNGSNLRLTVRFVSPIMDQLREQEELLQTRRSSLGGSASLGGSDSFSQTFSVSELYNLNALDPFINDHIKDVDSLITASDDSVHTKLARNSIYLKLLTKSISSATISSFEFFNHPIMQLFVVTSADSLETVKEALSGWKRTAYPSWLDIESILELVLIIVDPEKDLQEGLRLQEQLKLGVGVKSLIVPLDNSGDTVNVGKPVFSQLGEEVSRKESPERGLPRQIYETFSDQIQDIIHKQLIPHMERKVRLWTEEYVAPRKSFTGRFFNAGKKWGGNGTKKSFFSFSSSEKVESTPEPSGSSYNKKDGYYNIKSPEMAIRRLADWNFMLRDYRSSYTTYELLKKDFLNDKAYNYLASLQEFMVISLIIGASNKVNPLDKPPISMVMNGITAKIISEVINPLVDSSFYSYLSRCNLKTYSIRLLLIIAELFFILGQSTAYFGHSQASASALYYNEAINLFTKLIDSHLLESTANAVLMERVAYIYSSFGQPEKSPRTELKESYYEQNNPQKLQLPSLLSFGQTRHRKSILWLLLAAKELDPVSKSTQTKLLVECIEDEIARVPGQHVAEWMHREDGLLYSLKKSLGI